MNVINLFINPTITIHDFLAKLQTIYHLLTKLSVFQINLLSWPGVSLPFNSLFTQKQTHVTKCWWLVWFRAFRQLHQPTPTPPKTKQIISRTRFHWCNVHLVGAKCVHTNRQIERHITISPPMGRKITVIFATTQPNSKSHKGIRWDYTPHSVVAIKIVRWCDFVNRFTRDFLWE